MMARLSLLDAESRSKPVAKKWIAGATEGAHGQFRRKAEAAGKSTREYAKEEENAPGKLGKEARLAETLMGMHHSGKHKPAESRRKAFFTHPTSHKD